MAATTGMQLQVAPDAAETAVEAAVEVVVAVVEAAAAAALSMHPEQPGRRRCLRRRFRCQLR